MNTITPVKTEYRGIVFDSKSEAIFARMMDLIKQDPKCKEHTFWNYHPERFSMNGYCPDFSTTLWVDDGTPTGWFPYVGCDLIEYKPTRPTKTYFAKIIKYYDDLKNIDSFNSIRNFFLCCGSAFDGKGIEITSIGKNQTTGNTEIIDHICDEYFYSKILLQEAKNYRFDLDHQNT